MILLTVPVFFPLIVLLFPEGRLVGPPVRWFAGVVATEGVFAMGLAGIDAALYAGSWSEWITDSTRPIEVGESTEQARSPE